MINFLTKRELRNPNPVKVGFQARVREAVRQMRQMDQAEMPVEHVFWKGHYARIITMPTGAQVVGHIHKTRHPNVILRGRVLVNMGDESMEVVAPASFMSDPDVQKVLVILEETEWMTIHDNPDDSRDIVVLEESLIEMDHYTQKHKGNLTVDELRMKATRENLLCHSQ